MNIVSGYTKPLPLLEVKSGVGGFEEAHIRVPSKPTLILHDIYATPQTNRRKIFIQFEPELTYKLRSFLLKNASYYDYILTFDDVVLKTCPNARKCLCAACWVPLPDILSMNVADKQFKLSGLFADMNVGEGRLFRKRVYERQLEIKIPFLFYRSSSRGSKNVPEVGENPYFPSQSSKIDLFRTFQFSIVFENSSQINYFTEKLIDCLVTKTIPVYWGCPNIHEYFDTTGWILLKTTTFEEFQEKIGTLTPEYYSKYTRVIEDNFQRAMKLADYHKTVNDCLSKIPNY